MLDAKKETSRSLMAEVDKLRGERIRLAHELEKAAKAQSALTNSLQEAKVGHGGQTNLSYIWIGLEKAAKAQSALTNSLQEAKVWDSY